MGLNDVSSLTAHTFFSYLAGCRVSDLTFCSQYSCLLIHYIIIKRFGLNIDTAQDVILVACTYYEFGPKYLSNKCNVV